MFKAWAGGTGDENVVFAIGLDWATLDELRSGDVKTISFVSVESKMLRERGFGNIAAALPSLKIAIVAGKTVEDARAIFTEVTNIGIDDNTKVIDLRKGK